MIRIRSLYAKSNLAAACVLLSECLLFNVVCSGQLEKALRGLVNVHE